MTLEELRTEAKKHGYKLTKEYPYISLAPCVCGHKKISSYFTLDNNSKAMHFHRCYKCGLESEPARTKYEAKLKWNECVENAREELK
jgi:hypothetical protein